MTKTNTLAQESLQLATPDGGTPYGASHVTGGDGNPNLSAYSASKAAVIGLTKSLAFELAPHHVTVNCIAPGAHNTPRRAHDSDEERERNNHDRMRRNRGQLL